MYRLTSMLTTRGAHANRSIIIPNNRQMRVEGLQHLLKQDQENET